eukprot:6303822-Heterocapsa_arctica.AAC.1
MLRTPKPIPVAKVFGPMMPAPAWGELQVEAAQMQTKDQLDEITSAFLEKFEQELLTDRDLVRQPAY